MVVVLLVVPLLLAACGGSGSGGAEAQAPSVVEEVAGTDLSRVTLSAKAAQRLDIQTAAVEENGSGTAIPYAAVLYSPTGETWAYTNPKGLIFVRQAIVVDRIEGDTALLSEGPAPGTKVATVGVAELYGTESGIDQ